MDDEHAGTLPLATSANRIAGRRVDLEHVGGFDFDDRQSERRESGRNVPARLMLFGVLWDQPLSSSTSSSGSCHRAVRLSVS